MGSVLCLLSLLVIIAVHFSSNKLQLLSEMINTSGTGAIVSKILSTSTDPGNGTTVSNVKGLVGSFGNGITNKVVPYMAQVQRFICIG